jgi:DNA-binding transcriptional ArsR family regulator
MMDSPDATLDRIFAALADPTRRAIVSRLLAGDATVMDLAEPFEMSLPAVSKHIAILAKAGLITQSKHGRERWCRLEIDCLSAAVRWMESFGQVVAADWEFLERVLQEAEEEAGH